MKVYIGPYTNWVGPYQIADLLQYVGVSKDRCHNIGEWLSETWVQKVCQWFEDRKKRKVKIRIDKYDTWSMDSTLAMIIVPMLKQLQATKHGSPLTDDEDVPEHLRSSSDPNFVRENAWDVDDLVHARWDYIMGEMIWAFGQCLPDADPEDQFYKNGKRDNEGLAAFEARQANGFRLFGKYYRGLWD